MMLSMTWRITQIEENVVHRGLEFDESEVNKTFICIIIHIPNYWLIILKFISHSKYF